MAKSARDWGDSYLSKVYRSRSKIKLKHDGIEDNGEGEAPVGSLPNSPSQSFAAGALLYDEPADLLRHHNADSLPTPSPAAVPPA